jgi:hypothetical protein
MTTQRRQIRKQNMLDTGLEEDELDLDVTRELVRLIKTMPREMQLKLLKILDNRRDTALKNGKIRLLQRREKRQHPRSRCAMESVCASRERIYWDAVMNISAGGVHMETSDPLPVGQEVSLALTPAGSKDPIRIYGGIVWNSRYGFSVQFNEAIKDFRKRFTDFL